MKTNLLRLLAIPLLGIAFGCSSDNTPAPTYRFVFEPPDSSTAVVTLSRMHLAQRADSSITDSAWSRTNQTLLAEGEFYRYTHLADSLVQYRNGIEATDQVLKIFSSLPVIYKIDSTGRVIDVSGYEAIFQRFDSLLDPSIAAQLRQAVNPDMLREQEMTTWNQKFVPYVGTEMTLGQANIDTLTPTLPVEGRLLQYRITELADTVRHGDALCGKISIMSSTNPTELAEMSGRKVAEIAEMFGITEEQIALDANRPAGSKTVREWEMEFETMLTYSEYTRQVVFFQEPNPEGEPIEQRVSETQQRIFTY